jgi:ATPase subunit of ABC transporter with duplicated ATPase domains
LLYFGNERSARLLDSPRSALRREASFGFMLFVSHDRHFLAALSNRVLELTPEGIHQYGGGYTEYVARTGHEAPGLRS